MSVKILIRFPDPDLVEKVKQQAKCEVRTFTQQVIHLLNEATKHETIEPNQDV